MATCVKTKSSSDMSKQAGIEDFLRPKLKKGKEKEYLKEVKDFVLKHRGSQIQLQHEKEKVSLKVGTLEETSYNNTAEMLEEWEQFYLPDHKKMEVIGVLEEFPCDSLNGDLVLMVCEDGKIYAYECHRLHLVSESLEELFKTGLNFPGSEQYYRGQSFEDMTEDEWSEVKKYENVVEKQQEKVEYLDYDSFLKNLTIIDKRNGEDHAVGRYSCQTSAQAVHRQAVMQTS